MLFRSDYICRPNTWGMDFYQLEPRPNEFIVNKHRYSAFVGTKLDSVLRTLKIDTLLMCGVATNVCVESTARDGYMLDYNILFMEDCCAAFSKKAHNMTVDNINNYFGYAITTDQVNQWLNGTQFNLAMAE